jgi:hypothetical protein
MIQTAISRPAADEHDPYYSKYVALVPDGDIVELLESQMTETQALLSPLDDSHALHRYAPGKWSVKEVVGHLIDGERIFVYRALRAARADQTPVPGFDENTYVPEGKFDRRPLRTLLDELAAARRGTVTFFASVDEEASKRRVVANDRPISTRALAYVIAGHERHHVMILRERYGIVG